MSDTGPLPRYALPVDRKVLLDDDGFLLPQSDTRWLADGLTAPVTVDSLPQADTSFALLAAAGAGKTTVFQELHSHETNAKIIAVGSLTRENLERRLASASAEQHPIYLDGLDQAVLHDSRLLHWLEDELTTDTARRVAWRLACRPAAWEASLAIVLRRALRGFEEWRLLPLDRAAAEHLVTSAGRDGAEFLAAIVDARLGRMSACAAQLLTTARYWSRWGRLPRGSVEAIQFEIDTFLSEPNDKILPTMPLDRARTLAKRIGAFTMFSGTQSLSLVPHERDGVTLSVASLPSSPEPGPSSSLIAPDDYRDVLRSALFEFLPPRLVTFRHQIYVEYLAAAYLVDRDATPHQVSALLGTNVNGVLPFSRIGVASWLVALKPELVEQLIADNIRTFVSSAATVEISADHARAAVLEALLDAAARREQDPDWSLDLTGLIHPSLEDQISRRLSAAPSSPELLWWLARLANVGRCTSLAPSFAEAAKNSSIDEYARQESILAAGHHGDDLVLKSLRDLLDEDLSDPHNEVLSALIEVLHPQFLTASDLASALRPHTSKLIGHYRQQLNSLADKIPAAGLAAFTSRLAARTSDDPNLLKHLYELPSHVILRAWSQVDDPDVQLALAQLVAASLRTHHWNQGRFTAPWLDGPTHRRRALALVVAEQPGETWYYLLKTGLISADDIDWLLDQLPTMPKSHADPLTTCVPVLLREPSAQVAERILTLPPEHPAFAATNHLRGATAVDSPDIATEREFAAQEHKYEQEQFERREASQRAVTKLLEELESNPSSWWRLTYLLAENDDDAVFNEDLTARPGWQRLSTTERALVLQSGLQYLAAHRPDPQRWCGVSSLNTTEVLPDWEGVRLLSTLAYRAPDAIALLSDAMWSSWSHTIVCTWLTHTSSDNEPMRFTLLDAALTASPEHLVKAALDHLDELQSAQASLTSSPVYKHLGPAIASQIAHRLVHGSYTGTLARDALDLVAHHADQPVAIDTCLKIKTQESGELANRARAHLGALAPNIVIDEFASMPPTPDAVDAVATRLDVKALDHEHLVRAATLLLGTYPHAEDGPPQPGWDLPPHRHGQKLRDQILQQLADNGHVDALDTLRQDRPELDRTIITNFYLRLARSRQAELTLAPTPPDDLVELLRSSDARLVHNDADLVSAVVRMLDKQEHWIEHKGAFREIWNNLVPQSEDDLSDWFLRRCEELATSGVVVNREFHVVRNSAKGGIGTRIDLTATSRSPAAQDVFIAVEAKRIDNAELLTSMSQQLVERYLEPLGRTHGIYLAYWIRPDQRPSRWSRSAFPTAADLLEVLLQQAADERRRGMHITPYVLDISRPS